MVAGGRIPARRISQDHHLYLRIERQIALDRIIIGWDDRPGQYQLVARDDNRHRVPERAGKAGDRYREKKRAAHKSPKAD